MPEAVVCRCSSKYVIWKISQILHENMCRSLFIIKLQTLGYACNLIIKRFQHRSFPVILAKLWRTSFFNKTPIWEHFRWLHLQLTYKLKIYFTKVTGKHLWRRLFANNVSSLYHATLFKKKTLAQIFSCEICEFFKKSMLIEHIQATASGKRSWK